MSAPPAALGGAQAQAMQVRLPRVQGELRWTELPCTPSVPLQKDGW